MTLARGSSIRSTSLITLATISRCSWVTAFLAAEMLWPWAASGASREALAGGGRCSWRAASRGRCERRVGRPEVLFWSERQAPDPPQPRGRSERQLDQPWRVQSRQFQSGADAAAEDLLSELHGIGAGDETCGEPGAGREHMLQCHA